MQNISVGSVCIHKRWATRLCRLVYYAGMQNLYPTEKVYIKNSQVTGAGRGVFAKCDIHAGERIEICPVIEIPQSDVSAIDESILLTYFFFHGKQKERVWLALGYGSLYNHSYSPNASYTIHDAESVIEFVAIEDIAKDCEITFNYKAGNLASGDPLWFEV